MLGSFTLKSEWAEADIDAVAGGTLDGYYVQASYILTGETRYYDSSAGAFKGVSPSSKFLDNGGLGAWEATLRLSNLDYTDLTNGDEADSFTVGIVWYLNKNFRALFNYTNADLENGEDGDVFATRFQMAF